MTWNQVMALLAQGDSLTTRFIRRSDALEPLAIAITAMANTQGGTIVLGIDKVNFQLTGSVLPSDFLEWVSTVITPQVVVSLAEIQRPPHMVHVISVSMGQNKPYVFNGFIYRLDERTPSAFKPIEEAAPARPTLPPVPPSPSLPTHPILEVTLSQTEGASVSSHALRADLQPGSQVPSFSSALASSPEKGNPLDVLPLQTPPLLLTHSFSKALDEMGGHSLSSSHHLASSEPTSVLDENEDYPLSAAPRQESPALLPVQAPLNERQRQALAFISSAQTIQNKKYRALYSVSHKTAHLELTDMVNKGLIAPRGSGRSTHYILQETDTSPIIYSSLH